MNGLFVLVHPLFIQNTPILWSQTCVNIYYTMVSGGLLNFVEGVIKPIKISLLDSTAQQKSEQQINSF